MDFGDQVSYPTFQLSVGKWFSPVWGLRLNANYAHELNGFTLWHQEGPTGTGHGSWFIGHNYPSTANVLGTNTYLNAFTTEGAEDIYNRFLKGNEYINTDEGPGYRYDIQTMNVTLDFMVNLKHLFRPYNHKGFFNPVAYLGVGYVHTFGDKDRQVTAVNNFMGKGGLQLNFRLSDAWDLFLDAQMHIVPENFDRRVGDANTVDLVANAHLGFTYHFNFRHFIKADLVNQAEIDAMLRELNCPEVICPPVVVCPPIPEPEPEPFYLTPVFFTLDSYVVRDNQWMSIAKAAEYLYENPNARLEIAGYADKNTGNPAHNMKLSENRSKAVVKVLTEKFGIEASRLKITYYGDTVQPFEENDWNRVAIFVLP